MQLFDYQNRLIPAYPLTFPITAGPGCIVVLIP
jgi:small neutral amino acid transporter SnatA (MarC family)